MRKAVTVALIAGALASVSSDHVDRASASVGETPPLAVMAAYVEATQTAATLRSFGTGKMQANGQCLTDVSAPKFEGAPFRGIGKVPEELAHRWIIRHRVARCDMGEPYATLFVGMSAVARGESWSIAAPIKIVQAAVTSEGLTPAISSAAVTWLSTTIKRKSGSETNAYSQAYAIAEAPGFREANRSASELVRDVFARTDYEAAPKPMDWTPVARRAKNSVDRSIDVPSFAKF